MFDSVKPKWKELLFHKDVRPVLVDCLKLMEEECPDLSVISPPVELIFAAFSYFDVDELRVIVIGQDPYPRDAVGLSFATSRTGSVPASLRNIRVCLERDGWVDADILDWPRQGVLLLNKFLSIDSTQPKTRHKFWVKFTELVIRRVIMYHYRKYGRKIPILMWGDIAKIDSLPEYAMPLYWGHPSPAANHNQRDGPTHFKYCDHFMLVNQYLKSAGLSEIIWGRERLGYIKSPEVKLQNEISLDTPQRNKKEKKPAFVFVDGGCSGNGKAHAIASYAYYFPEKYMDRENAIVEKHSGIVPHADGYKPTNNRGELLAMILALERILLEKELVSSILVVPDSTYSMNIVTDWLPKWYKTDATFSHRKNPDYLIRTWKVLEALKPLVPVAVHQDSHGKTAPKKDKNFVTGGADYENYTGNKIVDSMCTEEISNAKSKK